LADVTAVDERRQQAMDRAHMEADVMRQVADPGRDATARKGFKDVERPIDRLNRWPAERRPPALLSQAQPPFEDRNPLLQGKQPSSSETRDRMRELIKRHGA
jgi:hypothetical protein